MVHLGEIETEEHFVCFCPAYYRSQGTINASFYRDTLVVHSHAYFTYMAMFVLCCIC